MFLLRSQITTAIPIMITTTRIQISDVMPEEVFSTFSLDASCPALSVGVAASVGFSVGADVSVGSGVGVLVSVGSGVGVLVSVGSGVGVLVLVGSGVGVLVLVGSGVGVLVLVARFTRVMGKSEAKRS